MIVRNYYPRHLTASECSELCACGHERYDHWNGRSLCNADCRCLRFVSEIDYMRDQIATLTREVRGRK